MDKTTFLMVIEPLKIAESCKIDNNIDENCDGIAAVTAVIDNDGDGFNSMEDCDDNKVINNSLK